jgi:ACS family hexuronate transporter-like MFS transporter
MSDTRLPDSKLNRLAWQVVFVLVVGSILNYVSRSALGIVMPQIRSDLGLSNAGYGVIVNSFMVFYTIFYILGGRVADRFGVRLAFYLMAVFWSLACMLHGVVRGFVDICIMRGLLGVGQGGYYPTAYRGVAEWFEPERRLKPAGFMTSGASIGALIAAPVVSWLTLRSGWRLAFFILGACCLLLVPAWAITGKLAYANRASTSSPSEQSPNSDGSSTMPLSKAIKNRKFLCLLIARGITDAVWYFYVFWMSGYFQSVRSFNLAMVGRYLWLPYLAATLGAMISGWFNNIFLMCGFSLSSSRKIGLTLSGCLCLTVIFVNYASSSALALALMSLTLLGHMAWFTYLLTAITEVSPSQHVATMFGLTGAAGTALGGLSQPLVGLTVDHIGYSPLFIACGGIFVIALILIATMGKIEPIT